jgi:hypothetical protein
MKKIDILFPTRNRVRRLYEVLTSIKRTVSNYKNVKIYVYVDEDDKNTLINIEEIKSNFSCLDIVFFVGPRIVVAKCWNKLWEISSGEILMQCGDDVIFRTKDWDLRIIEEFEKVNDEILLVYCNDGIQKEKLATLGFYSRKATEILNYFTPPYFDADWCDTWLTTLYMKIDRYKYLPDVITDHMHFFRYPQLIDDTYRKTRSKADEARSIWMAKRDEIDIDANKLRKFIKEFDERNE